MSLGMFALSLVSGLVGAVLVYLANRRFQEQEGKRRAIKEFIHRWLQGGISGFNSISTSQQDVLLQETYLVFSRSRATVKCFENFRRVRDLRSFNALLKAMCHSAGIKYSEFLGTYRG